MGELQSVKTVQLSVRPLFRPNTGPSGGARSTHGAPTATPPRSGAPRIFGFFLFLRATSLRAWWPPSSVDRCRVVNFRDRKRTEKITTH